MTTKVLVAGHTGTEKKAAAEKLKSYLPILRRTWTNRIEVVYLERCIEEAGGGDSRLFAGVRSSYEQRKRWLEGWNLAREKFHDSGATCQILCMHLSFATRDNYFCPADFAVIADWKPDTILTLIDDVYSVKRRIQLNHYTFSLSQLYGWRTTEQILADNVGILTGAINRPDDVGRRVATCDSLLLAVKTPLLTAARLIAQRESRRCYASFPISSTRGDPERKAEIDRFRRRLHRTMATLDPLAIDEKPMVSYHTLCAQPIKYDPSTGPPGHEHVEVHKRWDAKLADADELAPLVSEPTAAKNASGHEEPFFPVQIDRDEIDELALPEEGEGYTVVDDQIEFRDIRLVSQADLVVCYRPYWDGHITGGVNTEIENANMMGKEVVALVGNDKLKGKPLTGHITKPFKKEEDFWGYLETLAGQPLSMPRPAYY